VQLLSATRPESAAPSAMLKSLLARYEPEPIDLRFERRG
jgi:hypothetical protein